MVRASIVTEQFATQHWECPTRRHCVNEVGVIQDGDAAIYAQSLCSGSCCPVWRWVVSPDYKGYCGLGGKPAGAP